MKEERYLQKTAILNFGHPSIEELVKSRNWEELDEFEKIGAAYSYVKDEILFGYNAEDNISADLVLKDGYGQCNTKGSLLMALLRRLGIPCRFHGFTIDNQLQKGAIPILIFGLAPKYIIHSWVEIFYDNHWIDLEGFILDREYLDSIQQRFDTIEGSFCGYGIATECLSNPGVEWNGESTYIQKEGIHDDFGIYNDPDSFYREHGTNLSGLKKVAVKYFLRHLMNLNLGLLRKKGVG